MGTVIKVEKLSKAYQLGQIGTGTISRDLERWYAKMRGKEDPYLKIGESNEQSTRSETHVAWSLKDINFEIEQGDTVGIIGRNGAGKSTLLKILSKVTAPTSGKITGKGRIASLLEVGTGFHPELSGRENIFLNGAILGMRKKEIQRKLEEIVNFAGIERYLDTPVKRYSSGMYVRLAFAVAAHLESEILIVDEVLAVGDAEFQKKCLGKMSEVSEGEGRTVLFVSHNMANINQLCKSSILLTNGQLTKYTLTQEVISKYLNLEKTPTISNLELDDNYSISEIKTEPEILSSLDDFILSITIRSKNKRRIKALAPLFYNEYNQRVAIIDLRQQIQNQSLSPEDSLELKIDINCFPLIEGDYTLGVYLQDEIISNDFLNLFKFSIISSKSNTIFEYDTAVRGMVNLNFKITSNVKQY